MALVTQKTPKDTRRYAALEVLFVDEDSGMEIVRYSNGTASIRDTRCDQTMHSRVGPEAESRIVYAEAAKVSERLRSDRPLVLWDVGMGTGANVTATLDEIARNSRVSTRLLVESFESDPKGLALALKKSDYFPSLSPWLEKLSELLEKGSTRFSIESAVGRTEVEWRLHTGDFYTRMRNARLPDLVYFDFYSPKAHPELWKKERFKEIREILGDRRVELFTYSAATPTRLALLLAGFFVGYGPRTPMKSETTIAATRFEDLRNPLDENWLKKLDVSTSNLDTEDRQAGRSHSQWRRLRR